MDHPLGPSLRPRIVFGFRCHLQHSIQMGFTLIELMIEPACAYG